MKKDITIYDIAENIGVSPTTVSRALSNHPRVKEKTKKRIFETAQKLGYQSNIFATNLRRKHTFTIGVIVPRLNSPFQSSALSGMEKVASEAGYNLVISQSLESMEKEIANVKTMFNSRVDGLIVSLAGHTEQTEHFQSFREKEIPIVFFDRVPKQPNVSGVVIDNEKAAYTATSHLLEQGCRRIVHVVGNLDINVYSDRLAGYRRALSDEAIPTDGTDVIVSDLSEEAGEAVVSMLIKRKPLPDGLMVSNDYCAASCLVALKKRGIRVPEDIALVGFNNDTISRMVEPNLTTVSYPGYLMGETAMKNLIMQLKNNNGSDEIPREIKVLDSGLIVRGSSKRKANEPIEP
ncbi:MAG: LacI family DNA-binding transcriptional regulator [Lunatimonas sp.]|uniref:LacI family DNA-binding transcriptional regulator n=1 Tax=Lunatimonas sp. TaxID=2060141 RepID=UPI00263A87B1|nr:LacI family DNA-binding transcriptional regulator [Lunatimonas sp.]MCC5936843.1 LacI family DNA-binding transcriptional regulator [Lunatimonas sp.]